MACATQAFAFDPDLAAIENQALMQRFPKGSITTREAADQALREVRAAKSKLKELSEYSKRRCNENIFVNSCVEDVRKAELRQSRRLQAIESEARRIVREDETRKEAARQKERDAKAAKPPKSIKKATPRKPTEAQKNAQENKAAHAKRMKALEERPKEDENNNNNGENYSGRRSSRRNNNNLSFMNNAPEEESGFSMGDLIGDKLKDLRN